MDGPRVPAWLRRSLEAALLASVVAVASLVGAGLSAVSPLAVLLPGAAGVLRLAPAVLALGVIPAAYPAALAATRSDALFGSLAGFLIAADTTVILAGGRVLVGSSGLELPVGLLAVVLAAGPALAGITAGQLGSPVGFGRRAGAWCAAVGALAGATVVILIGMVGPGN